ncbi:MULTISPECIES: mechanosensitive ion channel family protein [Okeania]|uniref:Mechanosensitive ion channel MscS domain-containing protein n=1 Tax=Okeania hirsuta TaxID=1458930 RepID=A0A3N6Q8Q3_9CYAN|nr:MULTISPECIES: mechanosensitive ion channel domain-containing protein [Okeania]NET12336.1 mechanosensitive ion channel [Okeania sp. SIO1H6]NES78788.1 mechanosensitive ion channel [Okeania sp. SIO1H4]NES93126.1 mechanosensitive ion channel [Okeania sp. SIO2B9]NET22309.1 mechanosensitive ion channel [Okeania sp. SIO1H5]NET78916.1 mechanosensitive ion channel [Okeania sp. SIO1F9]
MTETIQIPEQIVIDLSKILQIFAIAVIGIVVVIVIRKLPELIERIISTEISEAYKIIISPNKSLIGVVIAIAISEITLLAVTPYSQVYIIEITLSLILTITTTWLGSQFAKKFFDVYLIEAAFRSDQKANSDLFVVGKFIANFIILVLAIIIFAQTHQVNVFGIIASLGVGGVAVAFAAQNTLSQLLGGIVLYVDRPFVVDDYIGLPDGTFGRVESIGLRSTKIRSSGKGTLIIIPNNSLTQVNIENFTAAKKVMSILYLTFYRQVDIEEQALIRQVILASTSDVFGIEPRNTDITFKNSQNSNLQDITQAQITFFILGSGKVSMDLRRQMLDNASQRITLKLKEYGIAFDIEQPSIYVDSPITV